ncbi:MAG: hypothetical protein RugAbin2_01807 [Rugosibacter sp.]|nr:hypothetical protein [Rugosibacter sp.]
MVSKYHPQMMKHAKGGIKGPPPPSRVAAHGRLCTASRLRRRDAGVANSRPLPNLPRTGEETVWLAARAA